jgi:hypothetical protein
MWKGQQRPQKEISPPGIPDMKTMPSMKGRMEMPDLVAVTPWAA